MNSIPAHPDLNRKSCSGDTHKPDAQPTFFIILNEIHSGYHYQQIKFREKRYDAATWGTTHHHHERGNNA